MNSRYSRQVRLLDVGKIGQESIENARVLIVGMGGLGCPSAIYLASAGVGLLGIVDGDVIMESNLHRQVLYNHLDLGKPKVEVATERLKLVNPKMNIEQYLENITSVNAITILEKYDIILDCSDNFETKYLLNDTCLFMGKTLVSASATGFDANLVIIEENGPCLRCLYPDALLADIGNCNANGILGAFVGIVGSWQAAEVLKIILKKATGNQSINSSGGRVLFFDFYNSKLKSVKFSQRPNCFCVDKTSLMPVATENPYSLNKEQILLLRDVILIDVRSSEEHENEELNGFETMNLLHIPHDKILAGEIPSHFWKPGYSYVFCCSLGKRSALAVSWLRQHGMDAVYSAKR